MSESPQVIVLAGPNGAGKSTSSVGLLQGALDVDDFVNADVIAQGLAGFAPDRAAIAAGRIMLARLRSSVSVSPLKPHCLAELSRPGSRD